MVALAVKRERAPEVDRLGSLGFDVRTVDHPVLSPLLGERWSVFEITRGGCACDFYREKPAAAYDERAIERYRKKKWSEARC